MLLAVGLLEAIRLILKDRWVFRTICKRRRTNHIIYIYSVIIIVVSGVVSSVPEKNEPFSGCVFVKTVSQNE